MTSEKAAKYRRLARECLKLVRASDSHSTRATLLEMAQVWVRLADQEPVDRDDENSVHAEPAGPATPAG